MKVTKKKRLVRSTACSATLKCVASSLITQHCVVHLPEAKLAQAASKFSVPETYIHPNFLGVACQTPATLNTRGPLFSYQRRTQNGYGESYHARCY